MGPWSLEMRRHLIVESLYDDAMFFRLFLKSRHRVTESTVCAALQSTMPRSPAQWCHRYNQLSYKTPQWPLLRGSAGGTPLVDRSSMVDWTSPGHPKVEVEAEAPACVYLFNMKFVRQYTAKTLVKKTPKNNGRKHNIILGSTQKVDNDTNFIGVEQI